jgi:hypothetical protein
MKQVMVMTANKFEPFPNEFSLVCELISILEGQYEYINEPEDEEAHRALIMWVRSKLPQESFK